MNPKRCATPLFAWREALTDPRTGPHGGRGCSRATLLVVAIGGLSLHMSSKGDSCFPSINRIAEETGLTRRQVQRAIRSLAVDGWLHVQAGGGRGRANRYYMRIPPRARLEPATVVDPAFLTPRRSAARQGDKRQARRRTMTRVRSGEIPSASELRCTDCPRPAVDYDHYLGYAAEHQDDVEPVCKRCHSDRESMRNRLGDDPDGKGVISTPFEHKRASGEFERATSAPEKGVPGTPEDVMKSSRGRHAEPGSNVASLDDHRARRAGSPSAHEVSEPPVWTFVWAWARSRGETRCFPQLEAACYPGDLVMPQAEYTRLEGEWRAAGSPRSFDPRMLLLSGKTPAQREEVQT